MLANPIRIPRPRIVLARAFWAAGLLLAFRGAAAEAQWTVPAAADLPNAPLSYNQDIRAILSNNCFACHGPDAGARKADLRLDTYEFATQDLDGRRAIVPGALTESELIQRLFHPDPDKRMPPPEETRRPNAEERLRLAAWVVQGAEYQPHWAYVPPHKSALPEVSNAAWPRNDIDRYILANLDRKGLAPSPEADRTTLIRRLSFDLVGLPPSTEEVDTFLNDTSDDAYEKIVDRLLASPHFGERLAIYWLDLVRYADTVGYHGDQVRGASGYRDFVINAFNDNMPFDEFTRDQLAGDLIENASIDQRLASGYNRLNMVTREGGAQEGDYVVRYAADRVRTTSAVWLGSSMACAQCHDHKYDPFTMKDFYSFAAFFADIKEEGVQDEGGNEAPFPPFIPLPTEEQAAEGWMLKTRLDALPPETTEAREKLQAEQQRLDNVIPTSVITETMEPRTVRVLARGNWQDESGEVVGPAIPAFLGTVQTDGRPTRMDLAQWLVSENNPLTARVFVNRLWKLYFGVGISRVLDDVGSQGEWPKHPALLDYLAVDFMESGWDIKHVVKQMVMSAAYRQSSMASPTLKEADPYNRLVARQSRMRLDAELVRDNALKISGLLCETVGGRSVMPYQPPGYYRELNFPTREYQQDTGKNLYRRGVYTHWQRTFLHPSLLAFDAPTREECTAERPVSNSPQQALTLLNDPIFVEASRAFAERIIKEGGDSPEDRIAFAYREALSRTPTPDEADLVAQLQHQQRTEFEANPEAAQSYIHVGASEPDESLDPVELAAWTTVGRAMFNLHETIYRY